MESEGAENGTLSTCSTFGHAPPRILTPNFSPLEHVRFALVVSSVLLVPYWFSFWPNPNEKYPRSSGLHFFYLTLGILPQDYSTLLAYPASY
ncbi:hypothetical protein EYZ11_007863 [Aspergillus tanneri]|uniref:Uncharacterized protein n=1 Tax=Aspergillus tanneri TaxID=1220188 RepID=A0A4S3JHH9_9EURO|nr:hypothetical protein EYZ11_007863 [Aspergillus tanneri]